MRLPTISLSPTMEQTPKLSECSTDSLLVLFGIIRKLSEKKDKDANIAICSLCDSVLSSKNSKNFA